MSWHSVVFNIFCGFVVFGVIVTTVVWAMWSKASDAIKHDDGEKKEAEK